LDDRRNFESRGFVIAILFESRVAEEALKAAHHAAAAEASRHPAHAARAAEAAGSLHAPAAAIFAAEGISPRPTLHALHAAHALHHTHAAHSGAAHHPHSRPNGRLVAFALGHA